MCDVSLREDFLFTLFSTGFDTECSDVSSGTPRRPMEHASQTDGTRLADRWNTPRREVFGASIAYFGANLESVENIRFFRGAVFQSVAFSVTPFSPVFCLRNRHFSPFSAHVFCAPSVPLGTKSLQEPLFSSNISTLYDIRAR